MTQTVPATCILGPGLTGLAIGVTVLNVDGTTYAAFSTTGVAETSVAGTYRKAGGVVCPDAGGYLVWGESGTDYAEATVESVSVNVTLWADGALPEFALETTAQAILQDTGTTLPALIASVAQTVSSTTDSTAAGSIARRRGDSWSISLTIGAITGYTSLWFTAKWDRDNTDAESVLQVKKNASGSGDGLLYVNGATAANAALGSITVSDATTGAIVIAVDETVTDDLPPADIHYDVQVLVSGTVSTLDSGTLTISADVTRAVA